MGQTYEMEFLVGASESDCFGRVRPSSLMHFIQEVAIGHVIELGIDRQVTLERLNAVWMVLRTRMSLKRPVLYDETVRLVTWAPPTQGPIWPREVEIFVGDESVGEVSTTWVMANIDTGRVVRPRAVNEIVELPVVEGPKFPAVGKIEPMQPLGEPELHRVRYSDLDMNRHVHNTRYIDFAADHIGMESMGGRWVREFAISYNSQCVAGDELLLSSASDGDRIYVRGADAEGKPRFEMEFVLADE